MFNLETITEHVVVDTTIQRKSRSSVIGAIFLEEYSIAIDSCNPNEIGLAFHKELETHFNKPVKYLFLTHSHSDHRGGMEAFKDATIIISQKCKENMPTSVRFSKFTIETFEETHILKENNLKVKFLKVAGHSIGSSVGYFPNEKVLFGGDLFFVGSGNLGLPFMSFYQNRPKRTGNPDEYLAAFETFMGMEIDVIIPGHGDLVFNPQEYLESQKLFFQALKKHFISAIEDGKSLEEIKMPELDPIKQAYQKVESETSVSKAKRFLDHYLDLLKKSFYNHYCSK